MNREFFDEKIYSNILELWQCFILENEREIRYYKTIVNVLAYTGKQNEGYIKKYTNSLFPWEEEEEKAQKQLSANELSDMYKKMINKK